MIKVKGKKSIVQQLTFVGKKHPTTGVVSTLGWYEIKNHIELKNNSKIESIRIDQDGLTIFWADGCLLGKRPTL